MENEGTGVTPIQKKPLNKKKIAIWIGVAALLFGAVHEYNQFSMKKAAVASVDSLKDRVHDKIAGAKDAYRDRQAKYETPTVEVDKRNMGSNDLIKIADTNGKVQIGDLSMQSKNADLLLLSAVQAGDLTRVKNLVESGVSLNFTNNKMCVQHGTENETFDMPENAAQLETAVRMQSPNGYALMTDCSKLFILESVKNMRAAQVGDEVYTLANYGFTDKQIRAGDSDQWKQRYNQAKELDLDHIKAEQTLEDVFNFLMDKTDFYKQANYTQLPFVFRNKNLPFAVRMRALKTYVDVLQNSAKIQRVANVEAVDALSKQLTEQVAKSAVAGSYNGEIAAAVKNELEASSKANSKMDGDFRDFVAEYLEAASFYTQSLSELKPNGGAAPALKRAGLNYQSELELSVPTLKQNGVSYVKDKQSMLAYALPSHNGFYAVDRLNFTIKAMNLVLDSGLVNVNRQYADGSTILHILANAPTSGAESSYGQGLGVLNRYLLNKGANPNLFNKKGQTALEVAMNNNAKGAGSVGVYRPILASYQDINYVK